MRHTLKLSDQKCFGCSLKSINCLWLEVLHLRPGLTLFSCGVTNNSRKSSARNDYFKPSLLPPYLANSSGSCSMPHSKHTKIHQPLENTIPVPLHRLPSASWQRQSFLLCGKGTIINQTGAVGLPQRSYWAFCIAMVNWVNEVRKLMAPSSAFVLYQLRSCMQRHITNRASIVRCVFLSQLADCLCPC